MTFSNPDQQIQDKIIQKDEIQTRVEWSNRKLAKVDFNL